MQIAQGQVSAILDLAGWQMCALREDETIMYLLGSTAEAQTQKN
jgi:hypothetical protein